MIGRYIDILSWAKSDDDDDDEGGEEEYDDHGSGLEDEQDDDVDDDALVIEENFSEYESFHIIDETDEEYRWTSTNSLGRSQPSSLLKRFLPTNKSSFEPSSSYSSSRVVTTSDLSWTSVKESICSKLEALHNVWDKRINMQGTQVLQRFAEQTMSSLSSQTASSSSSSSSPAAAAANSSSFWESVPHSSSAASLSSECPTPTSSNRTPRWSRSYYYHYGFGGGRVKPKGDLDLDNNERKRNQQTQRTTKSRIQVVELVSLPRSPPHSGNEEEEDYEIDNTSSGKDGVDIVGLIRMGSDDNDEADHDIGRNGKSCSGFPPRHHCEGTFLAPPPPFPLKRVAVFSPGNLLGTKH